MTPKEHEQIAEVNKQWREIQRDAERYRFLKDLDAGILAALCWRFKSACLIESGIDDTVDAAMAEHVQKQRAA